VRCWLWLPLLPWGLRELCLPLHANLDLAFSTFNHIYFISTKLVDSVRVLAEMGLRNQGAGKDRDSHTRL
jgi:hypothetical protein